MLIECIESENLQLEITLKVYQQLYLENSLVKRGTEVMHINIKLIRKNPFGGLRLGTTASNLNQPYLGGYHIKCPEPYFRPRVLYTFNSVDLLKINMN